MVINKKLVKGNQITWAKETKSSTESTANKFDEI